MIVNRILVHYHEFADVVTSTSTLPYSREPNKRKYMLIIFSHFSWVVRVISESSGYISDMVALPLDILIGQVAVFLNAANFLQVITIISMILISMYSRYRTLFPYKPDPMPNFFMHTLMSRIQNLGLF